MSNEFEKNDDLLSATPADRLKQLIEQVSGDKDAPEGLLELLKRMSEDPDLDAFVRDNIEEAAQKKLLRMNTPIAFMLSLKEKDGTILH